MIEVAVVEDDAILCEALAQAVRECPELKLAGAYADGESFLASLHSHAPDVVIMDLNLPGINGVDCTAMARGAVPRLQVLVCTVQDDDDSLFNALCAGAAGYLLKDAPPDRVAAAVKEIHAGGAPMSASIARRVISSFRRPIGQSDQMSLLSEREREVLEQLAEGYRYKEIADRLFLSVDTVRTHVRNLYDKLHVSSRTEALNKVWPRGTGGSFTSK